MTLFDGIALGANFLAMSVSLAIALLTLWQGRDRLNLLLVAFLLAIIANSFGLIAWRLPEVIPVDPMVWGMVTSSATGTYGILFFAFAVYFTDYDAAWVNPVGWLGGALLAFGQVMIWTGQVITQFEITPEGVSEVSFSTMGLVLMAALLSYMLLAQLALIRNSTARSRRLNLPLLLIIAATVSNVLPVLGDIPATSVLMSIAVYLLGYRIIQERLFNPIATLNQELGEKNRALAQANALKTQFLANMSHELRTPLNSIIGFTRLTVDEAYGELNAQQKKRLNTVIDNATNLLALINDVLDLSKIEAGRMVLHVDQLDLGAIVEHTVQSFEPRAKEKDLYLNISVPDDLPEMKADSTRIKQILYNLIGNAVKFTHTGGVTVGASLDGKTRMMKIDVADTGIGIPEDLREAIFEEFRQVDGSTTRTYEGTGLGLAITRRLVDMHGGHITLTSEMGEGSCFTVWLPLEATFEATEDWSLTPVKDI